jgi:hypothetical protein
LCDQDEDDMDVTELENKLMAEWGSEDYGKWKSWYWNALKLNMMYRKTRSHIPYSYLS